MAVAIIQIGRTKTGKTTETKKLLETILSKSELDLVVFDPNGEFVEETGKYDFPVWAKFEKETLEPAINSLIVIEEATISLDPKKRSGTMITKLVAKRHQNNTFILNFHSWRSVPAYIFDFVDYVVIRKTNDTLIKVKQKCDIEKVLESVERVQKHENQFYSEKVDLYS